MSAICFISLATFLAIVFTCGKDNKLAILLDKLPTFDSNAKVSLLASFSMIAVFFTTITVLLLVTKTSKKVPIITICTATFCCLLCTTLVFRFIPNIGDIPAIEMKKVIAAVIICIIIAAGFLLAVSLLAKAITKKLSKNKTAIMRKAISEFIKVSCRTACIVYDHETEEKNLKLVLKLPNSKEFAKNIAKLINSANNRKVESALQLIGKYLFDLENKKEKISHAKNLLKILKKLNLIQESIENNYFLFKSYTPIALYKIFSKISDEINGVEASVQNEVQAPTQTEFLESLKSKIKKIAGSVINLIQEKHLNIEKRKVEAIDFNEENPDDFETETTYDFSEKIDTEFKKLRTFEGKFENKIVESLSKVTERLVKIYYAIIDLQDQNPFKQAAKGLSDPQNVKQVNEELSTLAKLELDYRELVYSSCPPNCKYSTTVDIGGDGLTYGKIADEYLALSAQCADKALAHAQRAVSNTKLTRTTANSVTTAQYRSIH